MIKRLIVAIILVIVSSLPCLANEETNNQADTFVRNILDDLRVVTGVPAFSVAISQNGSVHLAQAVGFVDIKNKFAATTNHKFRLASVSKVIGATLLASEVQKGNLDVDAPIGIYLPDLPEQFRAVTTKQLLAHISGMPHYQSRDVNLGHTHYENALDALASVGDRQLVADPGMSYVYSTHGYTVLSTLYETVSGVPIRTALPNFLEEFTGHRTPAMEDIRSRDILRSNLFEVQSGGAKLLKPKSKSYSPFGTGFIATATDLALFGDAVMHNAMFTQETRSLISTPIRLSDGSPVGNYMYELAFGWRTGHDLKGRPVLHHAGVTPGARSALVIYPDDGLAVAFLSNASWIAQIERTSFAIANIILDGQTHWEITGDYAISGTFDGESIQGTLSCPEESRPCLLNDNNGALSSWLNQYHPLSGTVAEWPVYFFNSATSVGLKVVTSVGIVELVEIENDEENSSCFTAPFAATRILQLCIPLKIPRD